MKIGLIGDVHGEDHYLELALEALAVLKPDAFVCVGDIADGPGSIDRCVQLLQANNACCVMGNHDRWMLDGTMRSSTDATSKDDISTSSLDYLSSLPKTMEIQTPHGLLLLCHGLGNNDMCRLNQDDFDYPYTVENNLELQDILGSKRYAFVVSGHTHRWMIRDYQGITFVNAGTLKKEHSPGFALLNTETRDLLWFSISPKSATANSVLTFKSHSCQ